MLRKHHKWAFKYADQEQEAAMLVLARGKFLNSTMLRCIKKVTTRPVTMVELSEAEWSMWDAFDLCPTIEIFARKTHDGKREIAHRVIDKRA